MVLQGYTETESEGSSGLSEKRILHVHHMVMENQVAKIRYRPILRIQICLKKQAKLSELNSRLHICICPCLHWSFNEIKPTSTIKNKPKLSKTMMWMSDFNRFLKARGAGPCRACCTVERLQRGWQPSPWYEAGKEHWAEFGPDVPLKRERLTEWAPTSLNPYPKWKAN